MNATDRTVRYDAEDFLEPLRSMDPPVMTAGELRSAVDCGRGTFRRWTEQLIEEGEMVSRPVPEGTLYIDAEYAQNGDRGDA